ncbi:ABC transporter permease subunit [Gordonia hankookensis]|uniref:ATP-binding cassette domain-containing protein n=1 Tax=Gordonia hankookensis TaxID=589403 RepID=A0ABR7W970_9ACTN|nr:branched-chain amino acid ABC transporter permease/ATP-binding protein [Gordonia hankookensis]MBD1319357.1 ATP-binding cassette domain-containing protein [Gordonia hankookensis]
MTDHIQFLLLGLGAGGVFAALALALVIVYRSSGVINFATGSIALTGAYVYAFLRQGELVLLIPGAPKTIDVGGDPGFFLAAAISVITCAFLGLALYLIVFRPLRNAPPVARAVASIGVMIVFAAATAAQVGINPVGVDAIFPVDIWDLGSIRVPQDRVLFALTIVVVAIALAATYRFTRFGLATRATAESEEGAYVSGLSPDRVAATNWMIGSAVAGLAGILISPIVPLTPMAYTLFIVPALAAAVIGRFSSVLAAVTAGLVIGMLQSEATYLPRVYDWLPSAGLVELVPLVIVLVVLVGWARPLPSRGSVIVSELGNAPSPRRLVIGCVVPAALAVVVLIIADGDWRSAVITSMILAVIGLSQVVVTGYAGQVSLAQLTIAGAGAFLVGPITEDWGVPFPIAPLLAALLAAVIGVVIGLPALRVRGLTVAVVTLTMAYTIEAIWFRNDAFVGADGVDIPAPEIFGIELGIGSGSAYPRVQFGLLCLVVLTAVGLGVAFLRRSRVGTRMLAVRANERSAAASGVDVVRIKLLAFAIGAFIAGLGGCLFAYQQTNVSFQPFTVILGVTFFATVYLAGVTSISGGILSGLLGTGAVFYLLLDRVLGGSDYYQVIVGVALVVTVLFNPEGIVGPVHSVMARRRGRGTDGRTTGSTVVEPDSTLGDGPVELGDPVLSLRDVSVRYGGVVAVDGVTISVPSGAIVGLIGPNGAGKTTLIDAISGFARSSGVITLGSDTLDGLRSHRRIRAGLGRTFQAIELYDDLSVRENVLVGLSGRGMSAGVDEADLDEIFATLGLSAVSEVAAGELSQGQRQLVSIARALAGRPRVLLLDEPAGGLDTTESAWLGERLKRIRDTGITILLVEHDMSLVLAICDRIEVLNFGRLLAGGAPAEIRGDPAVAEAYLGTGSTETRHEERSQSAVPSEGVVL